VVRVLIVDDDRALATVLADRCAELGIDATFVNCASDFPAAFDKLHPDLVFLDVRLGDGSGLDLLRDLKKRADIPVAVMTGYETLANASVATVRGAEYFLRKPFGLDEFDGVLDSASRARPAPVVTDVPPDAAVAFVGTSKAMTDVCRAIGLAARSGATTLVEGESGVGKELAARAIHQLGGLQRPFAVVDCSTVVETLFESELFGHERGAFTGAFSSRVGKVELARGGVLFLDEIGELTPRLQAKLLRLLQERTFERVGGNTPIRVDFQLVAATNRPLERRVAEGSFRGDLFYRLDVLRVSIPPLRERKEDLPALVGYFAAAAAKRHGVRPVAFDDGALDALAAHDWPGNVRELDNVVVRCVLHAGGRDVRARDVSRFLPAAAAKKPLRTIEEVERDAILEALRYADWNLGRTCELLGVTRPRLRRAMRKYRLEKPKAT
jgi:two-component system response regulator AtoC